MGQIKKVGIRIFLITADYLLSLILGFLSFTVFFILVILVVALFTETSLEKLVVAAFSVTPGIGLGKQGTFSVNRHDILHFYLIWGLVYTLISRIICKLAGIEITINNKKVFVIGTFIHLISLGVFFVRFDTSFAVTFVGVTFILFLSSMLAYYGFKRRKDAVSNAIERLLQ